MSSGKKTNAAQSAKNNVPTVAAVQARDALAVIFAVRFVNALCVRTFFQPDEYFQALEPAWNLVFGEDSGAWLTWVRSFRMAPFSNSPLTIVLFALGMPIWSSW